MKKLFALLLAAMLLFSVAMAEETAEEVSAYNEEEITALEEQNVLDFDITLDKLPEGYVMTKEVIDHVVYATFTDEDITSGKPVYIVSVGYNEEFAGVTLNSDISGEYMLQALAALTEGYAEPVVKMLTTDYGTTVFYVNETGAESYYSELVTVYNGYIINMLYLSDNELTDDDLAVGMQIMSDLWVK